MKKIMFFVAITAMLASCGGGGGRPQFGDNEFPVKAVGTSQVDMRAGCGNSPESSRLPRRNSCKRRTDCGSWSTIVRY